MRKDRLKESLEWGKRGTFNASVVTTRTRPDDVVIEQNTTESTVVSATTVVNALVKNAF